MKSRNIVFTEINKAELLTEEVRLPEKNEILVQTCVSSISSGTERANLSGSRTVAWNVPEASEAIFPEAEDIALPESLCRWAKRLPNSSPGIG